MNAAEFMAELEDLGVVLTLNLVYLQVDDPAGIIDDELRFVIWRWQHDLINLLASQANHPAAISLSSDNPIETTEKLEI